MATKEFVGPVDCLAAALPDEEYFMLLARDPLAPGLSMIWASIRVGDFKAASENFMVMCQQPGLLLHYQKHPDTAKSQEAGEVAERMVAWRERNLRAGLDGRPTWKSSRAVGVERFVVQYAERTKDGVNVVQVPVEQWPHWLVNGWKKPLVSIGFGGATDGQRQPPDETDGDCA
jgi:hypothetical protein